MLRLPLKIKNLLPCNVSITGYLGPYLAPGMYKDNDYIDYENHSYLIKHIPFLKRFKKYKYNTV